MPGADRGDAAAALEHPHRHLAHRQPVVMQHQHRLDLGIVVRIVAGEERDRAAVVEPEARRRIGDALAQEQREQEGEEVDARAAADRRDVAGVGEEARAADHVGAVRLLASREQRRDLAPDRAGRRRRPGPCSRSRSRGRT